VAQEHTVIEELEQIEKGIDTLEKSANIAKTKMITNKSSIQVGQEQLVEFEKELADSRQELEQCLKLLSVRRMPSIAEVVFFDIPQSEITLRNQIISLLAQKEAEALARVEDLRAQYAQQQDTLRKRSELDSLYVDTMNLRMQQSIEKKQQRQDLLAGLRRQKSIYMAAINDLEASSRNLQRLIDSTQPQQHAPGSVPASVPFREMKGLLLWPAEGEVIAPFGRIQNPDSQTYTRHLGIDISSPAGHEIRVIHDGVVIYCDWFRGYGKLVILDHGDGYSSIYSHCSETLVKKGDFIRAGSPLGFVGETGSLKGPFLYFEIRENGQPVDPLVWLQRRN
jgi:septal ring factor EnvC (AmiA/AmiB activator)